MSSPNLPKDENGKIKRGPGRPKGSQNKVTRAAKEFLSELCDDPEVQKAVRERVLAGDTTGFFKALEMVFGKPKQQLDVTTSTEWVMTLPPGDDVAED